MWDIRRGHCRFERRGRLDNLARKTMIVFLAMSSFSVADDPAAKDKAHADAIRLDLDATIRALEELRKKGTGDEKASPLDNTAAAALHDLDAQLKGISKYEQGERELKGEVGGGFDGDSAPITGPASNTDPATNYKINSAVTLTRGSYPERFKLNTSVAVLLSAKKFQEDVSTLFLTYNHFTTRWAEIYAFAERISDSYLSIDQRWEVGGGTYVGWRTGLTKAAAEEVIAFCYDPRFSSQLRDTAKVRDMNAWSRKTSRCLPRRGASLAPRDPRVRAAAEQENARQPPGKAASSPDTNPFDTQGWDPVERTVYPLVFDPDNKLARDEKDAAAADFYRLRELRENAIHSIEERGYRAAIGVAISVLSEIERSTIKVLIDRTSKSFVSQVGIPNTETKSVTLDGAQVFRLTLRPTVRLRPSTHIYFEALPYFKLRLPPTKVDVIDASGTLVRRTDFRVDAHGEIRYILAGAETLGGEKFSVVGSYDFHQDNAPPFLAKQTLQDQGILGVAGDGISARRRHHVFKILLTVGWGG